MTKLKRGLLATLLVAVVSLVTVVFTTYLFFPYDRVADYLAQEIERPRSASGNRRPSGWRLSIGSLRPSLLPGGAVLHDVRIARSPKKAGDPALRLSLKEVSLRVGMLAWLFGTRQLQFEARLGTGQLSGQLSDSSSETRINLRARKVTLNNLVGGLTGIPMRGQLSGDIDLTAADEQANTEGRAKLTVRDLIIGDDQLAIPMRGMGTLNLPPVRAGNVQLDLKVDAGVGTIERLSGEGEDLTLRGVGGLKVLRPLPGSHPTDLWIRVVPSETYKTGDDLTSTAFFLLEQNPTAARYRTPDGAFQIQLTGSFGRGLSAVPAGTKTLPAD